MITEAAVNSQRTTKTGKERERDTDALTEGVVKMKKELTYGQRKT